MGQPRAGVRTAGAPERNQARCRKLSHVPIIDLNPRICACHERPTIEGVNGCLKGEFGGRRIQVCVHMKLMAYLVFGICLLGVDQRVRLLHRARLPRHHRLPAPGTGPRNRSAKNHQRRTKPGRKPDPGGPRAPRKVASGIADRLRRGCPSGDIHLLLHGTDQVRAFKS